MSRICCKFEATFLCNMEKKWKSRYRIFSYSSNLVEIPQFPLNELFSLMS